LRRIIKSGSLFVLAAALICVGVYAATNYIHNSNSNIDFVVGDVNITATAKIDVGSTNYLNNTMSITKDTTAETLDSWSPTNNIILSSSDYTVTYTFTFKNDCEKSTDITLTPPSGTAALAIVGGLKNEEVYNGNSVTLANKEDTATFTYTVTLQDFTSDITNAAMNFTIKMELTSTEG